MAILLLDRFDIVFDLAEAVRERNGLVGVSTELSVQHLLAFYPQGIFPWYSDERFFYWFTIAPRTVLYPYQMHIGRSLAKTLRNKPYLVTSNHGFDAVISACAQAPRPGQDGTWIVADFQDAYIRLHQAGYAHSFECWFPNQEGEMKLVGGLYGVQIGRVFFGESMFAWQNDASKIAFAHAVPFLAECGVSLIDCQMRTEHLARFGAQSLPLDDFQVALQHNTAQNLYRPIGKQIIHMVNLSIS